MDSKDTKQAKSGEETLPTYSEIGSTSAKQQSTSSTPDHPSTGSTSILHGQSPYQPNQTHRILILPANQSQSQSIETLTSSPEARREIRNRSCKRFWSAYFYGILIWMALSLLSGGIVDQAIRDGRDRNHGGHGHQHKRPPTGDWDQDWVNAVEDVFSHKDQIDFIN